MAINEPGTGSFPTMGVSAAQLSRVAQPEKGRSRPRGHSKGGSAYPEGTQAHRGQVHGRMGASLHPTVRLYEQNAAEASQMCRNVVQMPSKSSWTDNWRGAAKRASGAF